VASTRARANKKQTRKASTKKGRRKASTRKKTRKANTTESERQAYLEKEEWIAEVYPDQIKCGICGEVRKLDSRTAYQPDYWIKHRKSCLRRKHERVSCLFGSIQNVI
jgi:hypothetical protein